MDAHDAGDDRGRDKISARQHECLHGFLPRNVVAEHKRLASATGYPVSALACPGAFASSACLFRRPIRTACRGHGEEAGHRGGHQHDRLLTEQAGERCHERSCEERKATAESRRGTPAPAAEDLDDRGVRWQVGAQAQRHPAQDTQTTASGGRCSVAMRVTTKRAETDAVCTTTADRLSTYGPTLMTSRR